MVVLDATIVTIALPSIAGDLHLSGTSMTWPLNAYTLAYGGSLLIAGRLGDLYGPRRVFLRGITMFTLASLVCGFASTQMMFFIARAIQGLGGAVVSAVSLSLITDLFRLPGERARALGAYGFVCAAGGSAGQLFGGFLVKLLSWHWIFFIHLPVGITVYILCGLLLPSQTRTATTKRLDLSGAAAIAAASVLAVYAVIDGQEAGWSSAGPAFLLILSIASLIAFFVIESRAPEPLVPLKMFRSHTFVTANAAGMCWAAGVNTCNVTTALYLQRVLGYDPLQVSLAFAPAMAIGAIFSVGLSARVITQFGTREPLWIGLLLSAVGQALLSNISPSTSFVSSVLPSMLLIGIGGGMASAPLILTALTDLNPDQSGLASGVINTSFTMGVSFGLVVVVILADARTSDLVRRGTDTIAALSGGYHLASVVCALLTGVAAALAGFKIRLRL